MATIALLQGHACKERSTFDLLVSGLINPIHTDHYNLGRIWIQPRFCSEMSLYAFSGLSIYRGIDSSRRGGLSTYTYFFRWYVDACMSFTAASD